MSRLVRALRAPCAWPPLSSDVKSHRTTGYLAFDATYSSVDQSLISFAWNGKHAAEFEDVNQAFRWGVVDYCFAHPTVPSVLLVSHLFLADADWSREAWGSPHHFAQLGALLLERGGADSIDTFSVGFGRSFDTFGACHAMSLSPHLLAELSAATILAVASAPDESSRDRLTAVRDLFTKLTSGTASQGWATVAPGTPVSNVRIVWPRWYQRMWDKITGRGDAT